MSIRRAISCPVGTVLAAGLLALGGVAARAQDSSSGAGASANITGAWEFETKVYWGRCKMTGEMNLNAGEAEGEYVGQLIAREKCDGLVDENGAPLGPIEYYAEQTVHAERDGDRLIITATIDLVLPSAANYWPDDFALTIVHGSLMSGELVSFNTAPVIFFRGDLPIA